MVYTMRSRRGLDIENRYGRKYRQGLELIQRIQDPSCRLTAGKCQVGLQVYGEPPKR